MPEGDTIWRTARALHAALAGKTVLAFDSSLVAVAAAARRLGVVGQTIEAVEARGKHLLVRFAGGAVLHTHLGMRGSWRLAPKARAPPGLLLDGPRRDRDRRGRRRLLPRAGRRDALALAGRGPPGALAARSRPAEARLRPCRGPPPPARARRARRSASPSWTRRRSPASGTCTSRRFSSCAGSRPSPASATSTTRRSIASSRRRGSSSAATWGPARAGRRRPCRPCGTGSTAAPACPAGSAARRSSARCRATQARSTYFCPACQR